jgi:hypothetical protein
LDYGHISFIELLQILLWGIHWVAAINSRICRSCLGALLLLGFEQTEAMQSAKSFCECVSHPFSHISTPSACEQFNYSLFALHVLVWGFFFLSLFWVPRSSWFPWPSSPSLLGFVELAHIMTKPCRDRKLNSWETIMSEVHWSALDALLYLTTSDQLSPDIFLVLATNWRSDFNHHVHEVLEFPLL